MYMTLETEGRLYCLSAVLLLPAQGLGGGIQHTDGKFHTQPECSHWGFQEDEISSRVQWVSKHWEKAMMCKKIERYTKKGILHNPQMCHGVLRHANLSLDQIQEAGSQSSQKALRVNCIIVHKFNSNYFLYEFSMVVVGEWEPSLFIYKGWWSILVMRWFHRCMAC